MPSAAMQRKVHQVPEVPRPHSSLSPRKVEICCVDCGVRFTDYTWKMPRVCAVSFPFTARDPHPAWERAGNQRRTH